MKTLQSNLSVWALATLLSGGSLAACAQATTGAATASAPTVSPAKTMLIQPLQQMITKMKKLQSTGDPDFDYAFQAKIHTQGAQDLMKQEIQSGKDSSLKQMAQTLLTASAADVNLLDGALKEIKPTRPNQAFVQQQSRNLEAMSLKLQQTGASDKLSDSVDKNYMALMLDQRQDAIDMATNYLQYGKNSSLRSFAQQLVDKSKQQVEMMKTMTVKPN